MKVLYILNAAFMGGATISFINMLNGLMKKGVIPFIVIPRFGPTDKDFMDYLNANNIQYYKAFLTMSALHRPHGVISFSRFCLSFCSMIIKKVISTFELIHIIKMVHPNLIHTNTGVIREGLYAAKRMHIPHIIHLREYQDKDFGWIIFPSKSHFQKAITSSDYVITITNGIKQHFDFSHLSNVLTIYNGIYNQDEAKYISDKEKYFLCASRIIPEKGHKDVITAFSAFHKSHPDYKLIIAGFGDNSFIKELHNHATDLHCIGAIDFVGYQKDVRPYMEKAKALIVASYNEGFGRMTAESWFNGCMVIGRDTAGTKEILDITGGYRFNYVDDLLACMNEVADLRPDEYHQIISKAQSLAIKKFSNENNVESIYSLYSNLKGRGGI